MDAEKRNNKETNEEYSIDVDKNADITSKNISLFLMKPEIKSEVECFGKEQSIDLNRYPLGKHTGIKGTAYVSNTKVVPPKWARYIEQLTKENIKISNSSNKAVIIGKLNDRFFAITFGFGKYLLNDCAIERNFGIKCVVNTVNEERLKSISSTAIEDLIISTQKQVNLSTGQNDFNIDSNNEILKSISGIPKNNIVDFYTGSDSLIFRKKVDINKIKGVVEHFIEISNNKDYLSKGFEWIDNINAISEESTKNSLDKELVKVISNGGYEQISFSPKEIINWDEINGFMITGSGQRNKEENYVLDLILKDYFLNIKEESDIIKCLKNHKINKWISTSGNSFPIGTVYSNISIQIKYDNNEYVLNTGEWYKIDTDFYNKVTRFVDKISVNNYRLPNSFEGEKEGDYNKRVFNEKKDEIILFDRQLVTVSGGRKKSIEICDLFTKQNQFIHVKRKTKSAQLSHLFAQGKISAQCFVGDPKYRIEVANRVQEPLKSEIIKNGYEPNKYEVIYAIITNKKNEALSSVIPFFSSLNLMTTCEELMRMSFKYSVTLINIDQDQL